MSREMYEMSEHAAEACGDEGVQNTIADMYRDVVKRAIWRQALGPLAVVAWP